VGVKKPTHSPHKNLRCVLSSEHTRTHKSDATHLHVITFQLSSHFYKPHPSSSHSKNACRSHCCSLHPGCPCGRRAPCAAVGQQGRRQVCSVWSGGRANGRRWGRDQILSHTPFLRCCLVGALSHWGKECPCCCSVSIKPRFYANPAGFRGCLNAGMRWLNQFHSACAAFFCCCARSPRSLGVQAHSTSRLRPLTPTTPLTTPTTKNKQPRRARRHPGAPRVERRGQGPPHGGGHRRGRGRLHRRRRAHHGGHHARGACLT
jgi:hypothetical protein